MARRKQPRIIFITGTDTGVGKTVLTSLLLCHARQAGIPSIALKPFCTGGRDDALLLHSLQEHQLTLDQINPFYFSEPLAPLLAARRCHRYIRLKDVLAHVASVSRYLALASSTTSTPSIASTHLLLEGAGGLLAPLGEGFSALDIITRLDASVLIAAINRLGTINHTLLTCRVLRAVGIRNFKIVFMNAVAPSQLTPDAPHNARLIAELLAPVPVFVIPFLGRACLRPESLKRNAKKIKKSLAQILA